jgi:hypothetical protein
MRPMRALLAGCSLCVACNTHVFSPPTGGFPIESPASLGAQRHSLGADFSYAAAVFGPAAAGLRFKYRHGLSDQLEVSAAPSMIWISGNGTAESHTGIYALRAALKYSPIPHVAVGAGIGGGASAAGAFLSPDLGLTLGYENRYVVPFASTRTFVSAPIAPRAVYFTTDDDAGDPHDPDDAPDRHRRTPHFSYGVQLSLGLRVPLHANQESRLRPSISCAAGVTWLFDSSPHDEAFTGVGCGFELGF